MLFNSIEFVVLVLVTMLLYYPAKTRSLQVPLLILASFIFYGSHEPWLLLLLIFSVVINAFTSWKLLKVEQTKARFWAVFGVAINLSVLGFFKYAGLFANSLGLEQGFAEFLYSIPLPIGISFFTFQGISLVADTLLDKKREKEPTTEVPPFWQHLFDTTFYVAFFPQLVAGPIVKANYFLPQIKAKRFGDIDWEYCFRTLTLGYFLKMVVADNLKDWTFWLEFPYFVSRSSVDLVTMLFGYSMQIFADFAGYSLIAIGVAALFGYQLPTNFNFPYVAISFSDFWRRWHISLSSWLRDYLYLPLGGNRKGTARTYLNLFIVMFLGGLWHGAAWSYALWGTFHGVALAMERLVRNLVSVPNHVLVLFLRRCVVFSFATFAWLFFKLTAIEHVFAYVKSLRDNVRVSPDLPLVYYIALFSSPVIVYHLIYLWKNESLKRLLEPIAFGVMLFLLLFHSGTAGAFIYFQF